MKKFTKQFLKEVLQFTEEETKLTMEVQRTFPELLINEGEYIESARHLYLKLGLSEAHYAKWYKKNIVNNEFFLNEKDWFEVFTPKVKSPNGGRPTTDYKISLEFAKHLSMMQRTESSHKVRCYFILMEKAIKGMQEHVIIREPEKQGYMEMKQNISDWCDRNGYDKTIETFYTREANLLNESLFGMSALEIKMYLGYKDRDTREHLELEHNKALYQLQLVNSSLLMANLDFEARKQIIKETCKNKYKDLYIKK